MPKRAEYLPVCLGEYDGAIASRLGQARSSSLSYQALESRRRQLLKHRA